MKTKGHTITMSRHSTIAAAISGSIASLVVATVLVGCSSDNAKTAGSTQTQVTINELQSKNSKIESDTGKKSDWVELYNPAKTDQDLAGCFISDDSSDPEKGKFSINATVPAQGFLVLWLDDTNDPSTPLHFPFKLSGAGDYLFLNDPAGKVLESVTIPPDPTGGDSNAPDVSYGAFPDGSESYNWCQTPTPGQPNAADCAATDAGL